jgi:lipid A 3-O-deacylase
MQLFRSTRGWCVLIWLGAALVLSAATGHAQALSPQSSPPLEQPKPGLWEAGIGEGFRPGTQSFSLLLGGAGGLQAFGSEQRHDLALVSLSYGRMLGRVMGEGHWWRGNWELRGELFGGAEFSPDTEWLVGLTPHLRYNFATGTRLIPFLDLGAGVSATGIGPPDLSNTFEFNLQGGTGVHWFIRDNLSLTFEFRYLHLSCAGLSHPNNGLNSILGLVGLTWFF